MNKKDTVKEAKEWLENLTHNWRCIPDIAELRELLKWVYDQGKKK